MGKVGRKAVFVGGVAVMASSFGLFFGMFFSLKYLFSYKVFFVVKMLQGMAQGTVFTASYSIV